MKKPSPKSRKPGPTELSLRPYNGRLWFAPTREIYERLNRTSFTQPDILTEEMQGRYAYGEGKDGLWTYIIWSEQAHTLAHEVAHVILHVFERCGIDPREAGGEPFCYMQSQLLLEIHCHLDPTYGKK